MAMFAQFTVKCFKEHFVSDFANVHAGIVQDCNDPLVLLLHKVHDDLIVEVIDVLPGDALPLVLLLFLLQNQLNEELLQFLVAVVDAELFKAARKGIR